ncbi:BON domain-containing protein [Hymenobacter elongatus]|uniref:BON domain-containing protein n=1 Tax=Hymenobacter elongatus TaxID=877208 RepID=UPI001FDA4FA2|nr:BON domain-containing protein [Hymenobacter elongatus]
MQTAQLVVPPAPAEHVADADITAAVEMLLATKKGLTAHLIAVQTHGGIVQLTGFTDSLLARQRAEEIAQAVRGVRGLHSTLAVRPLEVGDAEVQRDVEGALADDPATNDYRVHTTVAGGVVTVAGMVQSWAEKQLVLRVIKGVRGVRAFVADHLTIRGGEILNSDEEMTTQIRELLDWDIRVNGMLVDVRTYDHVVHLSGTVGTPAEKDRLVAIAYQTGATRVDARDLFVAYWALGRAIRREKFAPKADEAIAAAVRDTLRINPRMRAAETLVQVHDGVVTMAGTVSNLRVKQDAEQDARHVVGVVHVHNLLKVRPERLMPDEDIRRNIAAALARDPHVCHFAFGVQVHGGQVLLTGLVATLFEQEQAGDVAAGVSGVVDVNNRLEVSGINANLAEGLSASFLGEDKLSPATPDPDQALAARIRARYCWSASLHDQEMDVRVEDGRATLTGTVDTWLNRKHAAEAAHEAGAREVNNHLLVLPSAPVPNKHLAAAAHESLA